MINKSVVIITGAGGGIGRETVLKFVKKGFIPVLVDIDYEKLQVISELIKEDVEDFLILHGDLQGQLFLKEIIDTTIQKFGRIDILINNAAWRTQDTMRTISVEDWEKTIRINLTAPAFLAKYAAETMEANKLQGVIINISSIMSKRVGGYAPAYTVCKGGIESLTYELAVLYGPQGIRVVAVNPGNIETEMSNDYIDTKGNNLSTKLKDEMNFSTPLMRAAMPSEIADAIYFLSSPEASFITGTTLEIDGGFSRNFNSYKIKKQLNPEEF